MSSIVNFAFRLLIAALVLMFANTSWGYAYDAISDCSFLQSNRVSLHKVEYDDASNLCSKGKRHINIELQKETQDGSFFEFEVGLVAAKELGGRLFTASNGIGTLGSLKILQRGDNIIFDDFTVGTARGMLGAGQKGATELVGPLRELLRFSQQNGAKTITLNGKFVTDEGAALGRGVVGDSFSFSFPATQEGLRTFLGGLR